MKDMNTRRFLGGMLTGIALSCFCFLIVASIIINGYIGKTGMKAIEDARTGNYVSLNPESTVNAKTVAKLKLLSTAVEKYYYYADDLSKEDMQENIFKSYMRSVGDVYTEYYTKEEFDELSDNSQGIFYGIGANVTIDEDTAYPMILKVIPDSPAAAAGVEEGDIIYKVEGTDLYGYSLTDAVNLIRGEKDTEVHISMVRDGELLEFTIVRGPVDETKVYWGVLEDNIGYIQITEFDTVTAGQFREAMDGLEEEGIDALIIDLRSNPGGNVDTVVSVAEYLLPEGLVFYAEDRSGQRQNYTVAGDHEFVKPLVVLVNSYSASASEILSGAVQDAGMGTIVGEVTFGKGVVQSVLPVGDGSGIKLTTAAYFTRNGRDINHKGVAPDILVELDREAYRERGEDAQFEAALDVLYEQLGIEKKDID